MKLQQLKEREKGTIALLGLALIWGLLPLLPRYLSISFTVIQQLYLRLGIGCILVAIIFFRKIQYEKFRKLKVREFSFLFLRSFIYFVLGAGLYVQALLLTKISNVEFISAIPMTAVLGFILLREKLTVPKV